MSLQAGLAALLETGLGDALKVVAYPATIDGVSGPTAAVWATDLKPLDAAPNGNYAVDFTVLILTAYQDPKRAEDDLAASLEAVLAVLWDASNYLLTGAQRTVSENNTIHSWTLTVAGGLTITPEA